MVLGDAVYNICKTLVKIKVKLSIYIKYIIRAEIQYLFLLWREGGACLLDHQFCDDLDIATDVASWHFPCF